MSSLIITLPLDIIRFLFTYIRDLDILYFINLCKKFYSLINKEQRKEYGSKYVEKIIKYDYLGSYEKLMENNCISRMIKMKNKDVNHIDFAALYNSLNILQYLC